MKTEDEIELRVPAPSYMGRVRCSTCAVVVLIFKIAKLRLRRFPIGRVVSMLHPSKLTALAN